MDAGATHDWRENKPTRVMGAAIPTGEESYGKDDYICAFCDGTGLDYFGHECPMCDGLGKIVEFTESVDAVGDRGSQIGGSRVKEIGRRFASL